MSNKIHTELELSLQAALQKLEESGDIVISTPVILQVVHTLIASIRGAYEGMYGSGGFSAQEIEAMQALIREAIGNKEFFDWEMPTLTGFTKEEFKELANKLRALS